MKFTTLIVSVACAVAFSSCCCQTQSAPKLRAMPTNLVPEEQPVQPGTTAEQPTAPVKVLDSKSK
ncbi:MAG: hypothetical protein IJO38_02095 [Akkermansia sp.]|nr:hypothetical protein [Akkermansia sp.]MBQ9829110.1 hypothetical protein [Akkermansia sp.]